MLEDAVVAWDGSTRARAALRWTLGRPWVERIHLVRVLGEDDPGYSIEAGCRLALEGDLERLRSDHPRVEISGQIVHGDVEEVLATCARIRSVLVLGTGGQAALMLPHRSAMLARLARDTDGPIALVPLGAEEAIGPVMAGIDSTPAGVAAAQIASAVASAQGAAVVTMHAVAPFSSSSPRLGPPREGLAQDLAAHFPHLLVRHEEVRGDVSEELTRVAATASLLVLGRHALPGPGAEVERNAVLGAPCPVLLVRETDALWVSRGGSVLDPGHAVH
jgi:nucleotide-binding universal stress UspA family protein